jgi:hypothetical protein
MRLRGAQRKLPLCTGIELFWRCRVRGTDRHCELYINHVLSMEVMVKLT